MLHAGELGQRAAMVLDQATKHRPPAWALPHSRIEMARSKARSASPPSGSMNLKPVAEPDALSVFHSWRRHARARTRAGSNACEPSEKGLTSASLRLSNLNCPTPLEFGNVPWQFHQPSMAGLAHPSGFPLGIRSSPTREGSLSSPPDRGFQAREGSGRLPVCAGECVTYLMSPRDESSCPVYRYG